MKILICSDGHAPAEKAIRFVSGLAVACSAEVTILGIVEHPADETALQEALRRQAGILRDQKVTVELVTRIGAPLAEIQKRATETPVDLVVIGAERKSGGPLAMSAKAYHVIKGIEPPVLVVVGNRPALRRILICSGGQTYIDNAVKLTGEIAGRAQLAVTILHVLPAPPFMYADLVAREEDVTRLLNSTSPLGRNLRREKEALAAVGLTAEIKLRHGLVVDELLNEIRQGDYDLVVTGSVLARGPVRSYILGDVTAQIVNRAATPVLVVRGGARPARGLLGRLAQFLARRKRSG